VARALLDTGTVVALVNREDRNHDAVADGFRGFRGTLLTTEAVVTETAYVLGEVRKPAVRLRRSLRSSRSWSRPR
jgi:predicted nucleic acid-binding protein